MRTSHFLNLLHAPLHVNTDLMYLVYCDWKASRFQWRYLVMSQKTFRNLIHAILQRLSVFNWEMHFLLCLHYSSKFVWNSWNIILQISTRYYTNRYWRKNGNFHLEIYFPHNNKVKILNTRWSKKKIVFTIFHNL